MTNQHNMQPEADLSWTPSRDSNSNSRAAMIAKRAKMVFAGYRHADFADPDGFVLQLGVVLERYSDEVIEFVTSPITGIQRKCKFPPSIAEMVEACDAQATTIATRERYRKMGELSRVRLPAPARKETQDFEHMTARYGRPLGPFEVGTKFEGLVGRRMAIAPKAKEFCTFTAEDLRTLYGAADAKRGE